MKKPTNTRRVILLDETNLLGLAIPLAALLRQDNSAAVIPVSPNTADAWMDREIEVENILIEYWNKRGLYVKAADKSRVAEIHVLGLYPWTKGHQEALWHFAENHGSDIASWTDNHEWPDPSFIAILNHLCPVIKVVPEQSILELIGGSRYPKAWTRSEYALTKDFNQIAKEEIAFRIAAAVCIGSSLEENTREPTLLPSFFLAIGELIYKEYHPTVDWLAERFEKSLDFPDIVKKKLRILKMPAKAERLIAYANLGKVANYIDIFSILFDITEEYPWLCAIKANGHLYAGSDIIDLDGIFASYPGVDSGTMLKILKSEVKHFRQPPGSPDG